MESKLIRVGYYWRTILNDAEALVKKCDNCKKHGPSIHVPARDLNPIMNPILFAQCGVNIIGPFKPAIHQKRYIIVVADYFTKWVEAEAIIKIDEPTVIHFIWKNIVTRFGVLRVLVFELESI